MKTASHERIRKLVIVALFAAMAYVLSIQPKFPLFPATPWMDVDFSDAPALVMSIAFGPWWGFLVIVVKSLFHLTVSTTGIIGFIANVICGGSFIICTGYFYELFIKKCKKDISVASSMVISIIPQIAISVVSNVYMLLPAYMGGEWMKNFDSVPLILLYIALHNLIKDVLSATLAFIVVKILNKVKIIKK